MWTRLSARTVLELFCVARQAERSVDKVLGNEWSEFVDYYSPEKVERIESLITHLRCLLPTDALVASPADRDAIGDGVPTPGMITVFIVQWFAAMRKTWRFRGQELGFMAATLESVLRALKSPHPPTQEALIALRMNLYTCEVVIECRCYGLPGLAEAARIEHLWHSPIIGPVKIIDLVGLTKRETLAGKPS